MMDSFDETLMNKSINISCLYLENAVETAFDISEIRIFTENSAFSAIREFTSKIIDAIVQFMKEIKEKIQRKYTEFKTKHEIDKIEKMSQGYMDMEIGIHDFYIEDKLRQGYSEILDVYCKAAKDVLKAYPNEEKMITIQIKAEAKASSIDKRLETYKGTVKKSRKRFLEDVARENFIQKLERDVTRSLNEINSTLERSYSTIYTEKKKDKDNKKKKHDSASKKRGVSICQKFQKDISMLGKKCANFYSQNKTAILVALNAVLATAAIAINARNYRATGYDKTGPEQIIVPDLSLISYVLMKLSLNELLQLQYTIIHPYLHQYYLLMQDQLPNLLIHIA